MTPKLQEILQTLWQKYIPMPDINKQKDGKKEEKL